MGAPTVLAGLEEKAFHPAPAAASVLTTDGKWL
jgi:hypothetical protein